MTTYAKTFAVGPSSEGGVLRRMTVAFGATVLLASSLSGNATTASSRRPEEVSALLPDWTNQRLFYEAPIAYAEPMDYLTVARYSTGTVASSQALAVESDTRRLPTETSEQVLWLHEESGLTWEQISILFGVSRRAVHAWAAGQRLSSRNAERLGVVITTVDALDGTTPSERRSQLLAAAHEGKLSLYDGLRRSARRGADIGDPLSAAQRMGISE